MVSLTQYDANQVKEALVNPCANCLALLDEWGVDGKRFIITKSASYP
jgi:cytidine deaminase